MKPFYRDPLFWACMAVPLIQLVSWALWMWSMWLFLTGA